MNSYFDNFKGMSKSEAHSCCVAVESFLAGKTTELPQAVTEALDSLNLETRHLRLLYSVELKTRLVEVA